MSNLSRRSFLAGIAGGAAALSTPLGQSVDVPNALAPAAGEMDLILLNGKIITVDPRDAIAEAMAVRGGRIIAVGTTSLRTIESAGAEGHVMAAEKASTSLYIRQGHKFQIADAMLKAREANE